MKSTQDLHIQKTLPLISPFELKQDLPITEAISTTILNARKDIENILSHKDPRLLVITGPCSIHDPKAALEYASRLKPLIQKFQDKLCIIMRVYFEKPRTTVGWKGFINDPLLDDSCKLALGLKKARKLLLEINALGIPTGTEMLDPVIPQYLADLISWAAIGARTTESQTHREMASGLSMPIGFKNGTDGDLDIAIDAMESACHPHRFLGINQEGRICTIQASGNPLGHLVLRGGRGHPNYSPQNIQDAHEKLVSRKLPSAIMVDCSHANSKKKFKRQEIVWKKVLKQRSLGRKAIIGMMLESHLHEGNQKIPKDLSQIRYGVSITDECVNFETTEQLLQVAYDC